MKKLLTFLFTVATFGAIVSCGSKTEEPVVAEPETKVAIVYSTGGKGDKSFNDSAYRGLERAKEELGISYSEYEPKDPSTEAKNQLAAYAESGEYDLIVGVGFTINDSLLAVATDFPEQNFAIIDSVVDLPNVASLEFKEHEGSFLMGAVAGLTTKTNVVGFIGGVQFPLIQKFEAGFEQGVKYVNPDAQIVSVYIGGNNGFNDPAAAKSKTEAEIQQGADIIYHAAGASGQGVFQAAKEAGVYAIGVDSNQDDVIPGTILTSMIKKVDNALFDVIKNVTEGKFEGKSVIFGIKEDGVGTTDFALSRGKSVSEETIKRVEEISKEIADGKIVVDPIPASAK